MYLFAEFISFSWRMKYATYSCSQTMASRTAQHHCFRAGLGEAQANKPKDLNFMAPYFLRWDTAALVFQEAYDDDLKEPFTIQSIQIL